MSVPFRSVYNNDFTNITTCTWSAHPQASMPFSKEMLEETVREVAGYVDAHFLQLATGRVPWYRSKLYSMEAHRDWWCENYGVSPDHPIFTTGYHKYLLDGNDPLRDFIAYCRKYGQAAFVSMRMNDAHGLELADEYGNTRFANCISKFYVEHPQYRLSQEKGWYDRGLNWIHEEVRSSLLELIEEQCANYELDGFELDFQRHPRFFVESETTLSERVSVMNDFIGRVREILDRTALGGARRYLSVRIPCYLSMLEDCGLEPACFEALGVDMAVISDHYFTSMDMDFAAIAKRLESVSAFFEMCHTTFTGKHVGVDPGKPHYDCFTFRRTTPEQYRTYANQAYRNGAQGMYFFNFAYYREHGTEGRGPFSEPPFSVIGDCRDPKLVASLPQDYLLTPGWSCWGGPVQRVKGKNLPRALKRDCAERFTMELYPQENAEPVTRLRLQTDEAIADQVFTASFNGVQLTPTADISEPFGEQYPPLLGTEQTLRAFTLPLSLIREGKNEITVTLTEGEDIRLIALNIAIC